MPLDFVLRSKATPSGSRRLAKAAVTILADSIRDSELLHNCDLVLAEACANVVRHAYDIRGDDCNLEREEFWSQAGDIEITIILSPGKHIELIVADWGRGLPARVANLDTPPPESESGRGLFIMAELTDNFLVRQQDGKNMVYMKLNIEEKLWTACE